MAQKQQSNMGSIEEERKQLNLPEMPQEDGDTSPSQRAESFLAQAEMFESQQAQEGLDSGSGLEGGEAPGGLGEGGDGPGIGGDGPGVGGGIGGE